MRKLGKWVLTMGIMTASPVATMADFPLNPFKSKPAPVQASADANQVMANRIADALRSANFKGSKIRIEFQKGIAKVSGSVPAPQYKALASETILKVRGVQAIDNQLVAPTLNASLPVTAPASVPAAATTAATPQPEAKRGGFLGLFNRSKPEEAAAKPTVQPASNQQTASANVIQARSEQPATRTTVQPAASSQANPNQLKAEEIGQALKTANFNGYDIRIGFRNGTAWLYGSVSDPTARMKATHIASQVAGVKFVDNQLKVGGIQQVSASQPVYPQQGVYQQFGAAPHQQQMAVNPQLIRAGYQASQGNPHQGMPIAMPPRGLPQRGMQSPIQQTAYQAAPPTYAHPASMGSQSVYTTPNLPEHSWPSYAAYPNYAQVNYPKQYDASAWPYIGPFYPYPQVPMGWRKATLEWDDGHWNLKFDSKTDKPFWFLNPKHW